MMRSLRGLPEVGRRSTWSSWARRASGQGNTQGNASRRSSGVPHISTGDMFRAAIAVQTDLGRRVEPILERGELVPDDLTIELIRERLGRRRHAARGSCSTASRARSAGRGARRDARRGGRRLAVVFELPGLGRRRERAPAQPRRAREPPGRHARGDGPPLALYDALRCRSRSTTGRAGSSSASPASARLRRSSPEIQNALWPGGSPAHGARSSSRISSASRRWRSSEIARELADGRGRRGRRPDARADARARAPRRDDGRARPRSRRSTSAPRAASRPSRATAATRRRSASPERHGRARDPRRRRAPNGDVVAIDVGVTLGGFVADSAYSYAVGEISDEAQRLLEACEASLMAGIEQARVGQPDRRHLVGGAVR